MGDGFAAKWINEYGSLDGIIEHAQEIKGKKERGLYARILSKFSSIVALTLWFAM